jgi:hypothetical protein
VDFGTVPKENGNAALRGLRCVYFFYVICDVHEYELLSASALDQRLNHLKERKDWLVLLSVLNLRFVYVLVGFEGKRHGNVFEIAWLLRSVRM